MTKRNIIIKKKNGSIYDELYPITTASNVVLSNGDTVESQLGEMENEKVSYTDLTPITTAGTSSDYVATIPSCITEVTIVPHINNIVGATLNSVPILDREGKPIEKDTLKANIPTKLVRVGSNFFIASSLSKKGSLSANRWKIIPAAQVYNASTDSSTELIGMNEKYVIYQVPYANSARKYFVAVSRFTGDIVCQQNLIKDVVDGFFQVPNSSYTWGVIEGDVFICVIYSKKDFRHYISKWDLTTNELTTTHQFVDVYFDRLFKSEDGYIYGHNGTAILGKIATNGTLVLSNNLGTDSYGGYLTEDANYLYFYKRLSRRYIKVSKETLNIIETIDLPGSSWNFVQHKTFVQNGMRVIWDDSKVYYFPQWDMHGEPMYSILAKGVVGMSKEHIYTTDGVLVKKVRITDGTYMNGVLAKQVGLKTTNYYKYSDDNAFITNGYVFYNQSDSNYYNRYGDYFEY